VAFSRFQGVWALILNACDEKAAAYTSGPTFFASSQIAWRSIFHSTIRHSLEAIEDEIEHTA
jgi:hypothetical protein